jgi:hypothetical protein
MVRPIKKEEKRTRSLGVSKGSKRINRIYGNKIM